MAVTLEVPKGARATAQRLFRVPPTVVYGMASRLEHLPRWSDLWMRADTLEKRGSRWTLRLRGFVAGLPAESVVRAELEPGRAVRWRQAYGTLLHYAAQFEVETTDEGTRARYTVELDPGIPVLDVTSAHQVAAQEAERTLDRMKWSAERELVAEEVRLMKVRPGAKEVQAGEVLQPAPAEAPSPALSPPALSAPDSTRRRRRKRRRRGRGSTV